MRLTRRSSWYVLCCTCLLGIGLVTTACSGTSSTTGSSTSTADNSTPSATANQSAPPTVTSAYCQSIASSDQVNQIFQLSGQNAVTGVDASSTECMYNNAASVPVISVTFMPYQEGEQPLSQIVANTASFDGGSNVQTQMISGVGEQAYYLSFTATSGKADYLFVLKGGVYFIVSALPDTLINSPTDATAQSEFLQVAQLVLKQL